MYMCMSHQWATSAFVIQQLSATLSFVTMTPEYYLGSEISNEDFGREGKSKVQVRTSVNGAWFERVGNFVNDSLVLRTEYRSVC